MASSTLLPTFPLEVKHEILKFCDQPTLANTSQVSLAFLQLSSPLLYRDINVNSEQLQKLLSLTVEVQDVQPHLQPYLTLSLIHSITFTPTSEWFFSSRSTSEKEFTPTRLLRSSFPNNQLPLHTLEIHLPEANFGYNLPISHYFEPVCFRVRAPPGTEHQSLTVVDVLGNLNHWWSRLDDLYLENAFVSRNFYHLDADPKRVVYDLSAEEEFWDGFVNKMWEQLDTGRSQPRLLEVLVLVSGSFEKKWVVDELRPYYFFERLTVEMKNGAHVESSPESAASSSP